MNRMIAGIISVVVLNPAVAAILAGTTGTIGTIGTTGTMPGQADCSAAPGAAHIEGPDDFVVAGPGHLSFTVTTEQAAPPACGDTFVLWVSAVEPNTHALALGHNNNDVRVRDNEIGCKGCELAATYIDDFPIAIDASGSAIVSFPDKLGPGRFLVSVRTQRGAGTTKQFAWSNKVDYLVTDPLYVELDRAARSAMIAHADAKQAAASTGADDPQKLWDDGELLRALAGSHRHFLRYEERGGGDRLVEVFGELAGARNIAVVVPGLDADARKGHAIGKVCGCVVSDEWVGNAERLWLNATYQSGHDTTATIAWLGYDAPRKNNVWLPAAAANGAGELSADLAEWQIRKSRHVTLIGHSYGSTTLGWALGQGVKADDVAFVGSPGVGVTDVGPCDWMFVLDCCPGSVGMSCFDGVDSHHGWVARFDDDPVPVYGRAGQLGRPPDEDGFGAIEFHTEPPDCIDWFSGYSLANVKCHSNYFSWGYTALMNLTNVVVGKYRDVLLVGKHPDVPKNLSIARDRAGWAKKEAVTTTTATTAPPTTTTTVPSTFTDPELMLQQLVENWKHDWPPGTEKFVDPDVVAALGPLPWANLELQWDPDSCNMGSSGSGACDIVGTNEHGYGNRFTVYYGEIGPSGQLRVMSVIDNGPGD